MEVRSPIAAQRGYLVFGGPLGPRNRHSAPRTGQSPHLCVVVSTFRWTARTRSAASVSANTKIDTESHAVDGLRK